MDSDVTRGGKFIKIGDDLYEMKISRKGKSIEGLSDDVIEAIADRIFPMVKDQKEVEHITLKASTLREKEDFKAIDRLIDNDLNKEVVEVKHNKTPSLLMKFYEFFEKKIAPEKYEKRHTEYAKRLVVESPLKMEKTRTFQVEESSGIKYGVMPKGIEASTKEIQAKLRNPKIGANIAASKKWHKNVEILESGGIKVLPYKTDKNQELKEGKVTPTSFIHAEKIEGKEITQEKKSRLTNIYLGKGKDIMRSGVIIVV